eukprot:TRINITY_DN13003_c0_g1_i1.p1 TRINITY_DN13003_c0_g1~~TRINITY_DN13003_c0_g1_i1.p1  ORF type:complete len:372 (-),score=42.15 TRINITY_DN13003_c0_g1_i1:34-1149(-)
MNEESHDYGRESAKFGCEPAISIRGAPLESISEELDLSYSSRNSPTRGQVSFSPQPSSSSQFPQGEGKESYTIESTYAKVQTANPIQKDGAVEPKREPPKFPNVRGSREKKVPPRQVTEIPKVMQFAEDPFIILKEGYLLRLKPDGQGNLVTRILTLTRSEIICRKRVRVRNTLRYEGEMKQVFKIPLHAINSVHRVRFVDRPQDSEVTAKVGNVPTIALHFMEFYLQPSFVGSIYDDDDPYKKEPNTAHTSYYDPLSSLDENEEGDVYDASLLNQNSFMRKGEVSFNENSRPGTVRSRGNPFDRSMFEISKDGDSLWAGDEAEERRTPKFTKRKEFTAENLFDSDEIDEIRRSLPQTCLLYTSPSPRDQA